MEPNAYMSCELKVNTKSKGWQKTVTKLLGNITDVSYTIDAQVGIAYISGRVDLNDLLKKVAKAKKHATLVRVDTGYHQYGARSPLVDENGYGYYPHNSCYKLPPQQPSQHIYYEPSARQQPSQHIYYEPPAPIQAYMSPPQQPVELYDSDTKCSIM